jgi:hypothetical protein
MKKLNFLFLLFVSAQLFAQTKGITYQAIIYNPSGEVIPGVNNSTAPMASKNICLQFSIIDATSQLEYQETFTTTTDEFGMVNLVIGNGVQIGGSASNFDAITWSIDQKSLKVEVDVNGQCASFVSISLQKLEYVPYAFHANSAENVSGIIPIENGGTNATTVLGAKTNLGLENVDNTSDLNKPISIATQAGLDLKENTANKSTTTTLGTSDVLFPTQNAVKSYVDASSTALSTAINNEATIRAAADAVLTTNLANEATIRAAADATLTTNLATEVTNRINGDATLTTNLANEATTRATADAILTTNLATEVTNRINGDAALTTNLANEVTNRTNADATLTTNLATEVTDRTNADLLKENTANKSTTTTLGTSNVLFPTQNAVKTYVDGNIATVTAANTALQATVTANAAAATAALNNEATIRANADAVLTSNLATEVTDRTNADLLKENIANKSTSTTLGTSNVLFPSQNAVKTYVDGNIATVTAANTALQATVTANAAAATAALNNEATIRAAADATLTTNLATEVTDRTNADLLKENTSNKSTATTLGTSNVLFPTQNAVKTYVDGNIATVTAANTAAIAVVQADVDVNETASIAADVVLQNNITTLGNTVSTNATNTTASLALKENAANKSTTTTLGTSDVLFPTQNAVKTYVDGNIATVNTANTSAIALVQANVDANETASNAADVVLQNNITTLGNTVSTNATNTTASLALKENAANKSTTTTLGTSDVLFPTQNAVKTYVDGNIATVNTANTSAIALVQANVDANETASNAADVVLQNNITTLGNTVTTNATNTTASLALKENTANKSTTTTLGTSDVLFPTQNAVKTYVDGSVTNVNSANTAAIAAVQADVDANESASNAADVVLQNNITTLGNTVSTNATNTTASLALKENTANKSTTTTLGTSDVLFPTQNAVKTYVDGSVTNVNSANTAAIAAVQADVDANESASNAADVVLQNNITTLGNTVTTNATNTTASLALKENTANKSTTTTLGTSDVLFPTQNAVKTYVDGNIATVIAANTAAIAVVQADVDANESAATNAISTLQNTVSTNATNTTNTLALKENTANKSTTTTLGTSDVLFPTQNAVKTYVDGNIATVNTANTSAIALVQADVDANESASNAADVVLQNNITTLGNTVTTNATNTTASLALKENTANKSTTTTLGTSDVLFPTQNAVKTYVDGNIATVNASNTATQATVSTLQNTVTTNATNTTASLALKENTANKSTTTTLGTSDVLFPTQNAVKTYVDAQVASATIADATSSVKGKIQLTGDLGGTAAAPTVPGLALKAPLASPTFTGTVTSPIYASTPQALTDAATINWNPSNGLNASVTLGGNRTLSFASTPAVGSYGTLIVTQDATGNRTITLPSTSNKVLGSASTTTIALSTAANAKDILNFYYDGANCYWNIGQGYGTAAPAVITNLATGVSGTLPVANGGSGAATLTGYIKGNGTSAMTANATIPVADVTGAAPIASPTFTGTPAAPTATAGTNTTQVATTEFVTGAITSATIPDATTTAKGKVQLAGDLGGTAAAPVVVANAITTAKIADANVTDAKIATVSGSKVTGNITGSAANVTGIVPVANGGTGQTTIAGVKAILGLSGTTVAIGASSGTTNQGAGAIGVGNGTGQTNQGSQSVAIGYVAGNSNQGANSVAIGSNAAQGGQGTQSVAIGIAANSSANNATALGGFSSAPHTNATAIGYQAVTTANNTIQLGADGVSVAGSTAITNVKTSGTLTAGTVTYPNTHGTTGQVLSTTGSGTLTWVAPSASSLSGTVAVANGGTGATTASGALTNLGAAPIASPTFTGTVTAPIYASTPQALTDAATINWNPASGLNASVTLAGNRTLSFTSLPAVGSYGTLIVTQDATGNRTITLPTTANKVLGSASTTTIALSTTANAKDILNFYYDGTNCYWNIGQGYGTAAPSVVTNLATGVSGTLPVANGGTGAATLTGLVKGNGTGAMTAAVAGTDYVAPSGSITGNAANVTGTVAIANGGTGATTATGALTNLGAAPIASPTFTGTPAAPTATAGTNTTQVATTAFVTNALSSAGLPTQTGNSGKFLTTNGSVASWAASSGVPYTGATGAVNLGAYNLTVNEVTIGKGNGSLAENTVVGKSAMANVTGNNNTAIGSQSMPSLTSGAGNTAIGSAAGYSLGTGSNNIIMGYNANMSGNPSNSIAIGTGIDVNTSNTIQLGNSSSTTLKTFAKITSGTVTYPNTHNSVAGQILTTDASGVSSWTSNINTTGTITAKNYVLTVPTASTAAANTTIDLSTGNIFKINLGANISTLTINNAAPGTYILEFLQAGTFTVTFPTTNWKWSGGSAPTITAVNGKTDIITIVYDGTTFYASAVQNF